MQWKIETRDAGAWALVFTWDLPVIQVAALMGGLGVRVTGHIVKHDADRITFELRPMDDGSAPPPAEMVESILRHGLPKYPTLVCRSLQES